MSVVLIDEFSMAQAPNSTAKLKPGKDFSVGKKCSDLITTCEMAIKNVSGGTIGVELGDALAAFSFIFASFTLYFGVLAGSVEVVDTALDYQSLQTMTALLQNEDQYVYSNVSSRWIGVNSAATSTVIYSGVANNASVNLMLMLTRTFDVGAFPLNLHDWNPGYTQMRNLGYYVTSGPTFSTSGNWALNSTISMRVTANAVDTTENPWAAVARWSEAEVTPSVTIDGPGGMALAAIDFSGPGYTSPLLAGQYAIMRYGDTPLQPHILFSDWLELYEREFEGDIVDYNSFCTVLWRQACGQGGEMTKLSDAATASKFVFSQPGNNITAPNIRWLYIPVTDNAYADKVAANATQASTKGAGSAQVNLTKSPTQVADPSVPAHALASAPLNLTIPSQPGYGNNAGRTGTRGQAVTTPFIPAHVTAAAQTATNAATSDAKAHVAATQAQQVARSIAGYTSPSRRTSTPGAAQVIAHAKLV
jgi:hypothetical protein